MTLAQMYGHGTRPALEDATGAKVLETPISGTYGEGVRVEIRYSDGRWAKLDCYPTVVFWLSLRSESNQRTGLYDLLARVTPPFFKERGVERYLADPGDDKSKAILLRRLNWRDTDAGFIETAI